MGATVKTRIWVAVLFMCAGVAQAESDLIVVGQIVHTMDAAGATAEAVVVTDGVIVFVGSREDAMAYRDSGTQVIESGATILPGFIDAHGHLRNLGRYSSNLQLIGTESAEQVREMVSAAQRDAPKGQWIRGRGWDQNDWDSKAMPSADQLRGTDDNPVYLRRVDGHACWVNRRTLELCGVDRDTPDPPGGRILRDENGNPTGVLIDRAEDLIRDNIPEASLSELTEWIRVAVDECNRLGLVGVHDAGIEPTHLAALNELCEGGELSLRVYCMLSTEFDKFDAFIEEQLSMGPTVECDDLITIRALKVYADGALGSRGAALLADYSDDPGNVGLMRTQEARLHRMAMLCMESGFQACAHAIGDRGNRMVLDAYENAMRHSSVEDHRFRVEHCQVLSRNDIPRFKQLGVIPSMQPTHCTSDMYWAEDRVGADRIKGAYAWRQLIDDGNRLPLGSDFPVESANPLWGSYSAATRQDDEGWPEDGWYPEERMTIREAVAGFTINAAYAEFAELERGSLEVGKLADIVVLDRDIFRISSREILKTSVLYTIVAGEVVYER